MTCHLKSMIVLSVSRLRIAGDRLLHGPDNMTAATSWRELGQIAHEALSKSQIICAVLEVVV